MLNEFKDVKLEIQGHTDDQPIAKGGKFDSNEALSQARAESVKGYMVKKGIDESRLSAKGYGAAQPVEDPKDLKGATLNAARAKNRRVEFKLVQNAPGRAAAHGWPRRHLPRRRPPRVRPPRRRLGEIARPPPPLAKP